MTMENSPCCQFESPAPSRKNRGVPQGLPVRGRFVHLCRSGTSATGVVLALLLPKCPLCVAAWAAALGVGATWQHYLLYSFQPQLRPLVIGLLLFPMLIQLAVMASSRRGKIRGMSDGAHSAPVSGLPRAFSSTARNQ